MTEKEAIKYLKAALKQANKERIYLRVILNEVVDGIQEEAHGHTPNWQRVMGRVEKYEDKFSPLGDIE